MPTITVHQNSPIGTAKTKHSAYGVQRLFRNGMTSQEVAAAKELVAGFFDNLTIHWSGGYANSVPGAQYWAARDFGPAGSTSGSRAWSSSGSRKGIDTWRSELDDLRSLAGSSFKINLVMHDIPEVMNNGFTRDSQIETPWPPAQNWGLLNGQGGYQLWCDIRDRIGPEKIECCFYGQEMKGVGSRTNSSNLDNFCNGYLTFAELFREDEDNEGILLGFPHYNFNATGNVNTTRKTVVDATIANKNWASLSNDDKTSLGGCMTRVANADPDLWPDVWTLDHSIVDHSSTDTWRGDYDAVFARLMLDHSIQKAVREQLVNVFGASYGNSVRIDTIEQYFDVNTGLYTNWQEDEQYVLRIGLMISNYSGCESTFLHWWEPQSGTQQFEGTDMVNAPFMNNDGEDEWGIAAACVAIKQAFPPGTTLVHSSVDDSKILTLASQTKILVLNGNASSQSITIEATGGTVNAGTLAAMEYAIYDLPEVTTPPPTSPEGEFVGVIPI